MQYEDWLAADPRRRHGYHLLGIDGSLSYATQVRWNSGSREVYRYDPATAEVEVVGLRASLDDGTRLPLHPDHLRDEALARYAKTLADQHGFSLYFAGGRDHELELAFCRPEMYERRGGTVSSDLFTSTTTEEVDAALDEFVRTRSPDKVELDPNSEWSRAADMAWEDAVEWQREQDELETRGEHDTWAWPDDDDTDDVQVARPEVLDHMTREPVERTSPSGPEPADDAVSGEDAPASSADEPDPGRHIPPTDQPEEVRGVLGRRRTLAPPVDEREERTLAELDQNDATGDLVRRLALRCDDLERLSDRATSRAERKAIAARLDSARADLRVLRRAQAVDTAFGRYIADPIDNAREARITTVTHDVLTTQPDWVVDHVRYLYDSRQLAALSLGEVAAAIGEAAIHQDLHGYLPTTWPDLSNPNLRPEVSVPEPGQ